MKYPSDEKMAWSCIFSLRNYSSNLDSDTDDSMSKRQRRKGLYMVSY